MNRQVPNHLEGLTGNVDSTCKLLERGRLLAREDLWLVSDGFHIVPTKFQDVANPLPQRNTFCRPAQPTLLFEIWRLHPALLLVLSLMLIALERA